MNKCKTCKFWERGGGYFCPLELGCCNRFKSPSYMRRLDEIAVPGSVSGGHGEGNQEGRVKTGPEFGCIHHETTP